MKNEIFEYWTKSGNTLSESMKALTEINTKAFTNLTEQQQVLVTNLSEVWAHQIQLATESKGYAELLSGQAKLAAEQREKLRAIVSDTTRVLKAARTELTAWVEKGFEAVTQPLKQGRGCEAGCVTNTHRLLLFCRYPTGWDTGFFPPSLFLLY